MRASGEDAAPYGGTVRLLMTRRTVAITPSKSKMYAFDEVRRVCQTCTTEGLAALLDAGTGRPFRFIYMSGAAVGREGEKTGLVSQYVLPYLMGPYIAMRVRVTPRPTTLPSSPASLRKGVKRNN